MQLRALIINDIDYWQAEFCEALEEKGVECETASTLTEAKDEFKGKDGQFDLILVDGSVDEDDNVRSIDKTLAFLKWVKRQKFEGMLIANSSRYNQELIKAGCQDYADPSNTVNKIDTFLKETKKNKRKHNGFLKWMMEGFVGSQLEAK